MRVNGSVRGMVDSDYSVEILFIQYTHMFMNLELDLSNHSVNRVMSV